MSVPPLLEELSGSASGALLGQFAPLTENADPAQLELLAGQRPKRKLAIYPASAGFDLVEELDHLAARAIEPNIFFNPRFLAPAMPRLEDREVRLAVIRDGTETRSRLRLLVPFSVERSMLPFGVAVLRTWANPFGPLGTPLVDSDDPAGVIDDFFATLSRPHLRFPKVFVLPEVGLDGPFMEMLTAVAEARSLPLRITGRVERPILQSGEDGDTYLKAALRQHHYREFRRLKRRLAEQGALDHRIARTPEEIRHGAEAFLTLEAAGWKGRARTAMATDRYRAAFAREAVHRLAERDMCRIHTLALDDKIVACLIVFVENGTAYTWKTAYNEDYAAYSPGTLLMVEVTKSHLADPDIAVTDSCAVPDHPIMSRLWSERRPLGTIVVGLRPDAERQVRKAAAQISLYRQARNRLRILRNRLRQTVR
ncbi:GNAT family N-acetyltransferase [Nitratireductor sp. ZSWI3]|uniref:GNAT family N-acetyltransferase n=1 Tax=Nitratireductor sp. ZSWI3 TaxID=2966359 RepID=UPI0021503C8D|nr:GNAT family N-acetyltransferase [Nitratireductor sp. ZSWI3]MCR4265537.1 GNAT family N-acetyltransferase [Nitratireductor sp. ZSWI3]